MTQLNMITKMLYLFINLIFPTSISSFISDLESVDHVLITQSHWHYPRGKNLTLLKCTVEGGVDISQEVEMQKTYLAREVLKWLLKI